MIKVYCDLTIDLIDKSMCQYGLTEIFLQNKYTVLTQLAQLKGEKVDVAYIMYDERTLAQLSELSIKKFSIFSKGDDDIVIPKNLVKYSSEPVISLQGKYYNIVLNNRNYKSDVEIIIHGIDSPVQDLIRNIYIVHGNVITSTLGKYNKTELDKKIKLQNLPNTGDIFYNTFTMIEGLKQCSVRKTIVKVKSDEYYGDIRQLLMSVPTIDKIYTSNVAFRKSSSLKLCMGDRLLIGKYEQISNAYENIMALLNNRLNNIRKKIKVPLSPEQITTMGFVINMIDYMSFNTDQTGEYSKNLLTQVFIIQPVDELGCYSVGYGKGALMSGKLHNKDLYAQLCEVKNIADL